MATDFADIKGAFMTLWETSSFGLVTAYENKKFTPTEGVPWARVTVLPARPSVVTLGSSGEDEHTGITQIDLFYPLDSGDGEILAMSDAIRTVFKAGTGMSYNGLSVTVLSCGRSGGRLVDGLYNIILEIEWRCRTSRA